MVIFIISSATVAIFLILVLFRTLFSGSNRKLKEGLRLEAARKYFEAFSVYDRLLKEGYSSPELRWKIANVALKIDNVIRAQKELSVLIELKNLPENVSVFEVNNLMVNCYLKQGQVKEAFFGLIELFKRDPNNLKVLFELGKIYAGQRYTGKAIKLFERCFKLNPNDWELTYYLGRAYLDFGDVDNALEYLDRTAKLQYFDNGKVNYYLGVLYFEKREYNIALQHFLKVLKFKTGDNKILSEAHHLIALCYKEKGLVDEAITNFEKSQIYSELLPKDSQNKRSLYNQGVLLFKNGQYAKALEKFYKLKMLDYKFKDIDKIIRTLTFKLKSGEKMTDSLATYINENPVSNIIKRGLLFAKTRFNVAVIEAKAEKYVEILNQVNNPAAKKVTMNPLFYTDAIRKFNNLSSREFKEAARKLINVLGYQIKAEPKFLGDTEYIDGNAINFLVYSLKNPKNKKGIMISVRRYNETVPELSVSRFLDWVEERGIETGIFIASNNYSSQALKVINSYPQVKFIDKIGLARILGRIK